MKIRHACVALATFFVPSLALLAGTTLTASAWAQGGVVHESLSASTIRFFASAEAKENALPSYALLQSIETGPKGKAELSAKTPKPEFFTQDGKQAARIRITPDTSLYGTGEVAGQLIRNGRRVTAWNTDAYGYQDDAESLYKSHPWVLAVRPDGSAFGVLADTTYRCTIDTAYSAPDQIQFIAEGPSFPVVVIEGAHPIDVVKELTRITGLMPLPPKWALGYHQCRYSYFPEARVRDLAKNFRDRDIPCDVIWYDIDYMEAFRVFTFDRGFFPDPKKLNADLLKDGFHNVWMIDPGMKSRNNERGPADRTPEDFAKEPLSAQEARKKEIAYYQSIIDTGSAQDVWVKRANGSVYEGEVWPSWCFFPDYTSPKVRTWWAGLYKDFMAQGITGVWNDMNEPAVFNVQSKTMPLDNLHVGEPGLIGPNGKPQGDRAKGDHARYHNVYGLMMIKGTRDGIQEVNPDKRPFVLSRATFIGGQRYHAGWSGDNSANWYHLEVSIPMVVNMSLSGLSLYGPDIGGFAGNGPTGSEGPFFGRWMGFGAMLPFARGHTGKGNIDKEPWSFGPEVEETCRLAIQRRMRFMPYIYTCFQDASVSGVPVARPTFFADVTDPALRSEDDSFLFGPDLLIASAVVPDRSRALILPKGNWREFAFEVPTNTKNTTKGLDSQNLDLPRLFARPGSIIPTGPVEEYIGETKDAPLTLIINLDETGKATGTLYEDAGDGYAYRDGQYLLTTYEATTQGGTITVKVAKTEGKMQRPSRGLNVRVLGAKGEARGSGKDGESVTVKVQ